MKRLTNNRAIDSSPTRSPDGTQIAFMSIHSNQNSSIYLMNVDGTDQRPVPGSDTSGGRLGRRMANGWPLNCCATPSPGSM